MEQLILSVCVWVYLFG